MDDRDQNDGAGGPTGGSGTPGGTSGPGGAGDAWIDSPPPPPMGGTAPGPVATGGGGAPPSSGPSDAQRQLRRGLLIGAGSVLGLGVVVAVVALAWTRGGGDADDSAAGGEVTATATASETASSEPSVSTPTVTVVDRAVPATQVWTAMDVTCEQGDTLRIDMYGSASHDQSPGGTVGPTGLLDPWFHQFNVEGFPDANTMAVIGSLGEDPSTYFVVGAGTTYVCPVTGELRLGVNDEGVENNSGAFGATITRTVATG
ncbi:hypothetical protein [Cellulomonas biazotea]|uniref:Uncharacterized protein n=1 Tax=Cellulomonas biazotea TaxID=1709 RepID=A0A402DWJ1_9CELL|nr:hypothetical protein [Cellulomonas biazotea]GCE78465.1 hypothetical protein CBZ_35210 [Cellulomonas biazotea]